MIMTWLSTTLELVVNDSSPEDEKVIRSKIHCCIDIVGWLGIGSSRKTPPNGLVSLHHQLLPGGSGNGFPRGKNHNHI